MNCLAICNSESVIHLLSAALQGSLNIEFIVNNEALSKKLIAAGVLVHTGDTHKIGTYLNADLDPTTCVLIEDHPLVNTRRTINTIRDAGGSLIYLLDVGHPARTHTRQPPQGIWNTSRLSLTDRLSEILCTELERSITRSRVEQYQRHMADADRVLIVLHNEPDPDALASGLALRTLLHRTKTTAIIGTFQAPTRPENLRMTKILDIQIETLSRKDINKFDRIATVDVQPHYFGGIMSSVDLVIDHHPIRKGYNTAFKDIRPKYGSTCTILTEHLRSVNAKISERTATAMLYAIKSDTLFLSRETNAPDLEAFRFLYPLANTALIGKIEGARTNLERLSYIAQSARTKTVDAPLYTSHLGLLPREDLIPYVADFLLQVEEISWVVVSGILNNNLIISVRNLDPTAHAGEFVNDYFSDIGNAGGHLSMAKAITPVTRFEEKFGASEPNNIHAVTHRLSKQFLQTRSGIETAPG
ncbi:MAG: hypothetical protein CL484_15075 [Acidobacteria bacterium]|nr:hypothetical protein [Acidobacteriota bacterium]|tara:strand:+ start:1448 stop:2866 length:1419 start_codon:yes stop_codon:yes gene_type:complete